MRRICNWIGVIGISLLSLVGFGFIVISYWNNWSVGDNGSASPDSKEICNPNCIRIYNNYSILSCQYIHIIYPIGCIILGVSTLISIGQLICIMIKKSYKYIDVIGSVLGCIGSILLGICLLLWEVECQGSWLGSGFQLSVTYYTLVIIIGITFIQNVLYLLLRPYLNRIFHSPNNRV